MAVAVAIGLASLVALAAVAAPSIANAADSAKTTVTVFDGGPIGGGVFVLIGSVSSPEPRCLENRKVKVVITIDGKDRTYDVARTSKHGGWLAAGSESLFNQEENLEAFVLKRTIGTGKHRLVCKGGGGEVPT